MGHRKPGNLWNSIVLFSRPGKSWNFLASHGKSWKIMFTKWKIEDEFLSKIIKKVCRTEDINLFKFDLSAILK